MLTQTQRILRRMFQRNEFGRINIQVLQDTGNGKLEVLLEENIKGLAPKRVITTLIEEVLQLKFNVHTKEYSAAERVAAATQYQCAKCRAIIATHKKEYRLFTVVAAHDNKYTLELTQILSVLFTVLAYCELIGKEVRIVGTTTPLNPNGKYEWVIASESAYAIYDMLKNMSVMHSWQPKGLTPPPGNYHLRRGSSTGAEYLLHLKLP